MNHLFVVHSNITYLAALGVICRENIDIDKVIILSELYNINGPVKCTPIYDGRFAKNKIVKYLDKFIEKKSNNEKYIAYVPAMYYLAGVVSTHKNCVGFNFIEEGASVYKLDLQFDYLFQLKSKYGYRITKFKDVFKAIIMTLCGRNENLNGLPLLYNSYHGMVGVKYYGFDETSFCDCESQLISFKDIYERFEFNRNVSDNFDNSYVWFGTWLEKMTLDDYIERIENKYVKYLKSNNITEIYIKFHPSEPEDSRQRTLNVFISNNIKYKIISNNVIMEIEFLRSKNMVVCGLDTSLLFYASMAGHKALATGDALMSLSYKKIEMI